MSLQRKGRGQREQVIAKNAERLVRPRKDLGGVDRIVPLEPVSGLHTGYSITGSDGREGFQSSHDA